MTSVSLVYLLLARVRSLRTLHSAEHISRISAYTQCGRRQRSCPLCPKKSRLLQAQEVRTPGVLLRVETGNKFCSDHCRDAHGMIELNCQCCHAGCECGPAS